MRRLTLNEIKSVSGGDACDDAWDAVTIAMEECSAARAQGGGGGCIDYVNDLIDEACRICSS